MCVLQSCSTQAEYAVGQQRAAQELQAARAETSRLAGALSQAEAANQALDGQLKDLHSQHRKVRPHICHHAYHHLLNMFTRFLINLFA